MESIKKLISIELQVEIDSKKYDFIDLIKEKKGNHKYLIELEEDDYLLVVTNHSGTKLLKFNSISDAVFS